MSKIAERLQNGIIKENPVFVMMLGMCPTMAVTTSAVNGIGMGLTTTLVLMMSNTLISIMRNIIPNKVRVPAFIVIVASFVTIVQFLLQAYLPELNKSLGIYIPLIVVNCIILGRAEAYASKNPVILSLFDGIGMGLGFTLALGLLGTFREIIGTGEFFGIHLFDEPIRIIGLAPGAFFVLAALTAVQNKVKNRSGSKNTDSGCSGNCSGCMESCSSDKEAE